MGTGIQVGKDADVGFVIGMAVMTGLFSILIAIFAILGGFVGYFNTTLPKGY